QINEERRISLIRMHTGEHILFKSLEKVLGEISLVKIDLDENESSLFIQAKDITWEKLFEAESLVNKIISEDREMIEHIYKKSETDKLEKVRIKLERIQSDDIRVLEVKDFDHSACAGTHAKTTGFIGNLIITNFSAAKGGYEIRFRTSAEKIFFEMARVARQAAYVSRSDLASVPSYIMKLKEEVEGYKERFRSLSARLLDFSKEENVGRFTLVYNLVEDVEKKQLVDKSNELAKGKVVCFISTLEGRATVLLNISPELGLDAPSVLNKVLLSYDGRGGGKGNFAMGSADAKHAVNILASLKDQLAEL
ncbi:MAG: hypothetical protein HGA85_08450, partial [Nanoarchaeota archaeon]|nr:hypothetical protein [Nanoarchaeota archaeon]